MSSDPLDIESHRDLRDTKDGRKSVNDYKRPRRCRWSSMKWDSKEVELSCELVRIGQGGLTQTRTMPADNSTSTTDLSCPIAASRFIPKIALHIATPLNPTATRTICPQAAI
jgi:hypothetical protein